MGGTLTNEGSHVCTVSRHFCFEKVAPDIVGTEIRTRAAGVARFVCDELMLVPPPTFIWLRPADPVQVRALGCFPRDTRLEELSKRWYWHKQRYGDIREGYTPGSPDLDEVWFRSDLSARPNLEFVVAHELRHAWQKIFCREVFDDESRAEGDAYPYGYQTLIHYLESRQQITPTLRSEIESMQSARRSQFFGKWPNGRFEIL